jgi:hypothetical protein
MKQSNNSFYSSLADGKIKRGVADQGILGIAKLFF